MKNVYPILQVTLALGLALFGLAGCGGSSKVEPLSIAEWQNMPPLDKYRQDTLDRLKEGDPKFQAEDVFDGFVHYYRLKDFPDFGKK